MYTVTITENTGLNNTQAYVCIELNDSVKISHYDTLENINELILIWLDRLSN